jgi:hypothetical protein
LHGLKDEQISSDVLVDQIERQQWVGRTAAISAPDNPPKNARAPF